MKNSESDNGAEEEKKENLRNLFTCHTVNKKTFHFFTFYRLKTFEKNKKYKTDAEDFSDAQLKPHINLKF